MKRNAEGMSRKMRGRRRTITNRRKEQVKRG
jgi:hypothetical protein